MNKSQRKELEKIANNIELLIEGLQRIQEEEQDKYDNAPESLQESERVQQYETNAQELEEAIENIDSGLVAIQNLFNA